MSAAERRQLMARQHSIAAQINALGATFGYSSRWTESPQYQRLAAEANANAELIREIDAARLSCEVCGEPGSETISGRVGCPLHAGTL